MPEEPLTIDDLMRKVRFYNPDAEIEVLKRAYQFSSEAHSSQKRVEGSPFIEHPVAVASILAGMKMDTATIAAGLLHFFTSRRRHTRFKCDWSSDVCSSD